MRYDNPKVRDIIDSCIPSREDYENMNELRSWYHDIDCSISWLVRAVYYALPRVKGFLNARAACDYLVTQCGGKASWCRIPGSNYCHIELENTHWSIGKQYSSFSDNRDRMSAKLGDCEYSEEFIIDSRLSAGSILAIDYWFPYICERALLIKREYDRLELIGRIQTTVDNVVNKYPDDMIEYAAIWKWQSGLKVDVFADSGSAYKRNNHDPILFVRDGYHDEIRFVPIVLSPNPYIPTPYSCLRLSDDDLQSVYAFIKLNLKELMELAYDQITVTAFFNTLK